MFGFDIYTHEIPTALILVKPYIIAQYPSLDNLELPKFDTNNYNETVITLHKQYGNEFFLDPIPKVDAAKIRNESLEWVENNIGKHQSN